MMITETYRLDGETLPRIPVPHDCMVEHITVEGRTLVFHFEEDVNRHVSIQQHHPNARLLTMRFHMIGDEPCEAYRWRRRIPWIGRRKCWLPAAISDLAQTEQTYLTHRVGECSMVITLAGAFVDAPVDCIDMIWTE